MVESWVEPATSASEKTMSSIAGSASDGDHHLAARADAAEAGADVHAGERQEEARAAEEGDDGDEVGGPAEHAGPTAKVGTSAAATQVAAKIR